MYAATFDVPRPGTRELDTTHWLRASFVMDRRGLDRLELVNTSKCVAWHSTTPSTVTTP